MFCFYYLWNFVNINWLHFVHLIKKHFACTADEELSSLNSSDETISEFFLFNLSKCVYIAQWMNSLCPNIAVLSPAKWNNYWKIIHSSHWHKMSFIALFPAPPKQ